ncbi:MAG: MotA/TolQ/ExbB proton channel family protein [Candidatus Thiodiazotropha sp.]
MFELVKSGGWLMLPIIACSIVALGIVIERFWSLQRKKVMPDYLMKQILQLHKDKKLNLADIKKLKSSSPLGRILAAGLVNRNHDKDVMKEAIEEVGRQVVHELERYLNTLGTIASISPLLGLLGTVIGMIKVFSVIVTAGVGDPGVLAGGISEALITTAAGLSVAIPSLMFHRYFSGLIDLLVIGMEEQALKLVELIHGQRED